MDIPIHSTDAEQNHLPSPPPPQAALGGWRAVRYILGNETFEKLASMSLIANLVVYLHTQYNMDNVGSANVFNIWAGFTNFLPLLGAFVADTYLGRFRTLLFGSASSLVGMALMSLTAGIPSLRPSCKEPFNCLQPNSWQLAVLFVALALVAIGSGGVRPCNISFGADQFDTSTEKGRKQLESFLNWWYFLFTIALLVALTAVVYIQTNVSWVLGFAIPSCCLALSIFIFLLGHHTYIRLRPQGSIFSDMAKVITAACRKHRSAVGQCSPQSFYDPPMTLSEPHRTELAHTDRFRFLDKAAIITDPNDLDTQGKPKNGWKLCSLQQVEQLKCVIGVLPVWLTGIGCFLVMSQMSSFGILQAIQMNRSVGPHFKIPPAWMSLVPMIALSLWIYIYERVYLPLMRRNQKDKRLTLEQRILVGVVLSILCMLVAGFAETKRRESALEHGSFESPISVALLVPQFALSGLTEAFAAIAMMELLTTHWPEKMKTFGGAVFFLSLSIASYLTSLLTTIVVKITGRNGKSPWLGGNDLNKNRLEYFYFTVAVIAGLNLIYFCIFSRHCLRYGEPQKPSSPEANSEEEESQID